MLGKYNHLERKKYNINDFEKNKTKNTQKQVCEVVKVLLFYKNL